MVVVSFVLHLFVLGLAYVLLHEYVWPIWYKIRARRAKAGVPAIRISHPLAIPLMKELSKAMKTNETVNYFVNEFREIVKKNTFIRHLPLDFRIVTSDPENIKTVLATKFNDFALGIRSPALSPIFGRGIFTLDGEGWKHSRAMLRPQFARDQLRRLGQVSDHVDILIKKIERDQGCDGYVEIQTDFHKLTMDTATDFLLGHSVDSLKSTSLHRGPEVMDPETGEKISAEEFIESYSFLNAYAFRRSIFNKLYWTQNSKEYRAHRERAEKFLEFFVKEALEKTSEMSEKTSENSSYVFSHELAKETRDPVEIRSQIFNILIAGRDTTASTMSFMIYYLASNPEVLKKLRTAILEDFGTLDEGRLITYEMLRRSHYLNHVINEVLRLAPIVPFNLRTAVRDTTLPRGGGPNGDQSVFVPKGMVVAYSVYVMQRDKNIWGEDAGKFDPERWNGRVPSDHWAFLPFNGGPRICLGQQFALSEIALTMVRLLQRFETIQPGPGFSENEPKWANTLTLHNAAPGVVVRFS